MAKPFLLAAGLVSLCLMAGPPRLLTIDDMHRFQEIRDPQISPDGNWVAYTVKSTDVKEDKDDTDVWMVSWDGARQLRLTSSPENETAPRWSPDGRYLSFLSSRPGKARGAQVWLLDRMGGEAQQLTAVKQKISACEWSPDSKRLLLVMQERDPNEPDEEKPDPSKPKVAKPIVIERYQFKRDIAGYLTGKPSRLYLYDMATKEAQAVTPESLEAAAPAWSPDGKSIAFLGKEGAEAERYNTWNVYVTEARPGAAPRGLTHYDGRHASASRARPEWSPDGTRLVYLQSSGAKLGAYNFNRVAVLAAAGGEPVLLTGKFDRGASAPFFSSDGKSIIFLVADDGREYPVQIAPAGGEILRQAKGLGTIAAMAQGKDGRLAVLGANDTAPPEIHALEHGALRRLTHHNDALLGELKLGATEDFSCTGTDGTEVHGLITRPPDYQPGRRYPSVLRIHGGPNSQDHHAFSFERQIFAANGYVVVAVNYRGSAGRGEKYQTAIAADWGNKEVMDLLAAMDYVVSIGLADPDRLGIGGWSYGGILTDAVIARDHRFKAATSGAGTALPIALYGVDQYIIQYDEEIGPPWKVGMEPWIRISYPFLHADRITTPTLFLGGERDFNVPLVGGEQMYQALRSLGVATQLVVYPGQFHGITRPSYQKDRIERYLAWYAKYLKLAEKPAVTSAGR
jgi:dipeptidyl aminopeptidase/acylaminoacyl peptidase